MKNYVELEKLKRKLLKNPEVKEVYDALGPEYQVACQVIEARLAKKMSQQELADRIGTGQAVVSRLEGMKTRPSFSFLEKVAKALHTKINVTFQ